MEIDEARAKGEEAAAKGRLSEIVERENCVCVEKKRKAKGTVVCYLPPEFAGQS